MWFSFFFLLDLRLTDSLCLCSFCLVDAAMAATFPYRGVPAGMPPGIPPPAPVPDYMTEEKLQEKGGYTQQQLCCFSTKTILTVLCLHIWLTLPF